MIDFADSLINFLILLCIIYQINILKNIRASLDEIVLKWDVAISRKDPEKDIHSNLNKRLLGIQQNRFAKTFMNYSEEE